MRKPKKLNNIRNQKLLQSKALNQAKKILQNLVKIKYNKTRTILINCEKFILGREWEKTCNRNMIFKDSEAISFAGQKLYQKLAQKYAKPC